MAVGVKPTIPGYEPDELGLLAISVNLLYHILDVFSIIKYINGGIINEKAKNGAESHAHFWGRLQQVFG